MNPESAIMHITSALVALLQEHAGATTNWPPKHLVVAYSGGIDSTVLLHVLASAFHAWQPLTQAQTGADPLLSALANLANGELPKLQAVHINHGLQACANDMEQHCRATCERLGVEFVSYQVTVPTGQRISTEQAARDQRYQALIAHANKHNAAICLAQHQTDQLETLLLQLKRGAGPKGLSGMPAIRYKNQVALLRPLLDLSQRHITALAEYLGCQWFDDPSNLDTAHERNFIRREVLPTLLERWPELGKTASRSARLCAEQVGMIESEAVAKLSLIQRPDRSLCLQGLLQLTEGWQKQVLRAWLAQQSTVMPSEAQMAEMLKLTQAKADAQPVLNLTHGEVRRFSQSLFYLPYNTAKNQLDCTLSNISSTGFATTSATTSATAQSMSVKLSDTVLSDKPLSDTAKHAIFIPWLNTRLLVQGGQANTHIALHTLPLTYKIKPTNRKTKAVKAWCKEWGIPPWRRHTITIIEVDDIPTAVATPVALHTLHNGISNVILTLG